jgi:predicted phosphoribosyltransferase
MRRFFDRKDAGSRLGAQLAGVLDDCIAVVVGLPRGGAPVAYEVARVLNCPLNVIVVRKVGVSSHQEFAMGAVGEDGVVATQVLAISRSKFTKFSIRDTYPRCTSVARDEFG